MTEFCLHLNFNYSFFPSVYDMKLKKVLLIDDDDTVNFINKNMIERSGITNEIIVKNSVLEALADLKREAKEGTLPELIFVDINMPEMDGWEFIENFSRIGSSVVATKIILLTSIINSDNMEKSKNIAAITAMKEKPVTMDMLNQIEAEFN